MDALIHIAKLSVLAAMLKLKTKTYEVYAMIHKYFIYARATCKYFPYMKCDSTLFPSRHFIYVCCANTSNNHTNIKLPRK